MNQKELNLDNLNRFTKSDGTPIKYVSKYVKEYIENSLNGCNIRIGTDSALRSGKSVNITSICFNNGPTGRHVINMKTIIPLRSIKWLPSEEYSKLSKKEKRNRRVNVRKAARERLELEYMLSLNLVMMLINDGIPIDCIECVEIDINNKSDQHLSSALLSKSLSYCASVGIQPVYKSGLQSAVKYSDYKLR